MTAQRLTIFPQRPASGARLGYNATNTFFPEAMQVIRDGGGTVARGGPAWSATENYATGALSVPAVFEAALTKCAQLGITPMLFATYGPPYATLTALTLTADAAIGSTVLHVTGAAGAIASIDPPYCHIANQTNVRFVPDTGKNSYYGVLIDSVNAGAGTVTLACRTSVALVSGTKFWVRRLRYPSLPDLSATNPGVLAYIRYAEYLANLGVANGCEEGYVELWNEMPWAHDRWDSRAAFYDADLVPSGLVVNARGSAIIKAALLSTGLPAGWKFINGMTGKSGGAGVLSQAASGLIPTPTGPQLAQFAGEAIHPYGAAPENYFWDPSSSDAFNGVAYYQSLIKEGPTTFGSLQKKNDGYRTANGYAPAVMSTECGGLISDDTRQAMYLLRHVATNWGCDVLPVIYTLADVPTLRVVEPVTYTPRQSYTALARLMALVAAVGGVGGNPRSCPTPVACPSVFWPPMFTSLYGPDGGLLLAWRRTYPPSGVWQNLAVSETVDVTLHLPTGYVIAEAVDVVTGNPAPYSLAGSLLTLPVGESVVAVRTAPA